MVSGEEKVFLGYLKFSLFSFNSLSSPWLACFWEHSHFPQSMNVIIISIQSNDLDQWFSTFSGSSPGVVFLNTFVPVNICLGVHYHGNRFCSCLLFEKHLISALFNLCNAQVPAIEKHWSRSLWNFNEWLKVSNDFS